MGSFSLFLRAPFVAAVYHQSASMVYVIGSVPIIATMLAPRGVAAAGGCSAQGRSEAERAMVGAALILSPLSVRAIHWGHPEELLGAALCVAAVIVASRGKGVLAGLLLGCAITTQAMGGPGRAPGARRNARPRSRELVVMSVLTALAFTAPMVAGNSDRFFQIQRAAGSADPQYVLEAQGSYADRDAHVAFSTRARLLPLARCAGGGGVRRRAARRRAARALAADFDPRGSVLTRRTPCTSACACAACACPSSLRCRRRAKRRRCSRTTLPLGNARSWTRSHSWFASHRPQPPSDSSSGRARPASGLSSRPLSLTSQTTVSRSCQTRRTPSPPPWRTLLVATSWVARTRSLARSSETPAASACSATSARMSPRLSHTMRVLGGIAGSGRQRLGELRRRAGVAAVADALGGADPGV